jgi:hypothetical protein
MAVINFFTAIILQRIHGYDEKTRHWTSLVASISNLNAMEIAKLKNESS